MKLEKKAFKETVRQLKKLKKNSKQEFKSVQIKRLMEERRRFKKSDMFYGRRSDVFLSCAMFNPASTLHFSFVLKENVKKELLEKALLDAAAAFPSLCLEFRRGFFSLYLQQNAMVPALSENSEPARPFYNEKHSFSFRTFYFRHRISLEISGYIADFASLKKFACCLVGRYLQLSGGQPVLNSAHYLDKPRAAALADPFKFLQKQAFVKADGRYLKLKGDEDVGITNITSFECDSEKLNQATDGSNAYLIRLLGQAVQKAKGGAKKVRIGVLADGRKFYPTETDRSFLTVIPCDETENFRFEGTKEEFDQAAARNLESLKRRYRYMPFPFKQLKFAGKNIASAMYADAGETVFEADGALIRTEAFFMSQCPLTLTKSVCKDKTVLCLLSKFSDTSVEYEFFKLLKAVCDPIVGTNRRNNIL